MQRVIKIFDVMIAKIRQIFLCLSLNRLLQMCYILQKDLILIKVLDKRFNTWYIYIRRRNNKQKDGGTES